MCRTALAEARQRHAFVQRALESLDPVDTLDLEAGKARVRRRLDERRDRVHRRPILGTALGRAAAILLLVSGVVYALPHSPVSRWIGREATDEAEGPASVASPDAASEGVQLTVPEEGLVIGLSEVPVDLPLIIDWVGGREATVVAGPGARYSVAEGRAEARVSSGPVLVRIPRAGGPVTLEVNGDVVLTRDAGDVEVRGAVSERTDDRLLFTPGGP
ncbi:MAG: hypothetical protein R3304_09955 [Longimicrobiales bacterium]|nr:hypothetical protein [Longimicrobiales bacterium]